MKKDGLSQKKKEKNMNIIMHDALHYFEKNGYDNTTIEQLCQEAMISQSTFFNYFGTKEKIVEMIMEDGLKDYADYTAGIITDDDPLGGLKAALDFQAGTTGKYCNTVAVFHRLAIQSEELKALENKYTELSAELVMRAFDKLGRTCPFTIGPLKDMIGGYFVAPFMLYGPEEASEHIRKTTDEFIELLRSSVK